MSACVCAIDPPNYVHAEDGKSERKSRDVREAFIIAFMSRTSDIPTPHRLAAASTLGTYFSRDSAHGNVAFDQATEFLEDGQSSPGSSVRWSVWR